MQGQDLGRGRTATREALGHALDLADSGEEREDVTVGALEGLSDAPGHVVLEPLPGLGVEVLGLDREAAALGAHHGRAEEGRHGLRIQGGAHDHDPEVRPHLGADALGQGEDQITLQVPLVELIENEGVDALQEGVLLEAAEQDPLGAEHHARVRPEAALEAHRPADLLARRPSLLGRHPAGRGARRQPPRLQDPHRTLAPCQRRGDAGGLASTRLGHEHAGASLRERGVQRGQDLVDGQGLHPCSLAVPRASSPPSSGPRAGRLARVPELALRSSSWTVRGGHPNALCQGSRADNMGPLGRGNACEPALASTAREGSIPLPVRTPVPHSREGVRQCCKSSS